MYYLGIDWGKSKCGIAIADEENKIASSYKQTLETEVYREVFVLNEKEKIEKIILGFHSSLENNKHFQNFLAKIKKIGIEIELENEDFSTQMAQKNMINANRKKISRKDDMDSARIILQSWLDKRS